MSAAAAKKILPKKISDSEGREFKFRAMHTVGEGRKPDTLLQQWLDRYMPLPLVKRPPGYVAGGLVRARVQARAEERAKRVAKLIEIRKRPHRGPPLILTCVPPSPACATRGPSVRERLNAYEEAKETKVKLDHINGLRERGLRKRALQKKVVRENAKQRARERKARKALS
ncbi:hypothetical protein C8R43DRAFT_1128271 [Mycena crocata]|nr:hypothetical protein C8R43DRAFT_1128271 [Mycena crocata]